MLPKPNNDDDQFTERRDPLPFSEADLLLRFRCRNALESAQRSAMKAAFIGSMPFVALAPIGLIFGDADKVQSEFAELFCLLGGMLGICALYVLLTGYLSGWIAHRIAFGTAVTVSRLAIAIAWVANLSLWGWAFVVVMGGL